MPPRLRLFESLIVFQNYVVDEAALRLGPDTRIRLDQVQDATDYPVTLVVVPGQHMRFKLLSHSGRFPHAQGTTMLRDLWTVLEAIATQPGATAASVLERIPEETRGRATTTRAQRLARLRAGVRCAGRRHGRDRGCDLARAVRGGQDRDGRQLLRPRWSLVATRSSSRATSRRGRRTLSYGALPEPDGSFACEASERGERRDRDERDKGACRKAEASAIADESSEGEAVAMSYADAYDPHEGIAIVALAGRFPGARDVEEFWENLVAGRETISLFAEDELEPPSPSTWRPRRADYVRARGILEDVELFERSSSG